MKEEESKNLEIKGGDEMLKNCEIKEKLNVTIVLDFGFVINDIYTLSLGI